MLINKKADARKYYSEIRNGISGELRQQAEELIFHSFINSFYFNNFETILCYVSVKDEVDTKNIINFCLDKSKTVYIPKCIGKEMFFYRIRNLSELTDGKFGIPTVNTECADLLTDFSNALCIVPAFAFDKTGNRIGYGGGYYDRFLKKNKLCSLGLAFDLCISSKLPSEDYDEKVDAIITESGLIITKNFGEREGITYE